MIVPADKGSVEGAVILPFPLDRVRPALLPVQGDEGGTGGTVVAHAPRSPIVFLRSVRTTVGDGILPPAA
jgi:hypothetical protein